MVIRPLGPAVLLQLGAAGWAARALWMGMHLKTSIS